MSLSGLPAETPLVRRLETVALDVARAAVAVHEDPDRVTVHGKGADIVTSVDHAAQRAMVDVIRSRRPEDGILGEEGLAEWGESGVRWVIDPLDGTMNYVLGSPHRSVAVGVEIDGLPALGVVIDSGRGDVFTGSVTSPSLRNGRPIRVGDTGIGDAVLATGFSPDPARRREQAQKLANILPRVRDIRRSGSPALDLCSVAAGWVHGFFEGPLGPWDHTAGEVIVRAAGGATDQIFDGSADVVVAAGSQRLLDEIKRLILD